MEDWKVWAKGLLAAAINGFAGGLLLLASEAQSLDDPQKFAKAVVILVFISVANYLKKSPLPGEKADGH